ncbi:MAG: class I SAM-dependent methyltransferase [Burkholderiaceae bacterium]|jgi:SAM-dependent methyltransferase|nr:class I SAM-dependent methyltransferase [Burkholderiaceae bacterium]
MTAAHADGAFRAAVERAARRFRPAGHTPYHFARGKLGGDPVFASVLRQGLIAPGARIVDIGCGQGVLAALLAECERGDWPRDWAPPPRGWTLTGFDLRRDAVAAGQRALADLPQRAHLVVGDARAMPVPPADVAVIFDVLHYIDFAAQDALLSRVADRVVDGGRLLLRVGDADAGWRFRVTLAGDWLITLIRGTPWPRFWTRPLSQWIALLERLGFEVAPQPMSEGTPFANVLLVATRRRAGPVVQSSSSS